MSYFIPTIDDLPEIDTRTMIEVDRLMMEDYEIGLVQMMENAGRCLAILTRERIGKGSADGLRVAVLSGGGGNGGGVLTAARRLSTWGAAVYVCLAQDRATMTPVALLQLEILERLDNVHFFEPDTTAPAFDVMLDGLIGYSLKGDTSGRAAELINFTKNRDTPVLALDVPSGFDAATGILRTPHITATATLTIAMPKVGMRSAAVKSAVGDLYCADISVPGSLYQRLDPPVTIGNCFASSDIIRVTHKD